MILRPVFHCTDFTAADFMIKNDCYIIMGFSADNYILNDDIFYYSIASSGGKRAFLYLASAERGTDTRLSEKKNCK